MTRRLSPVLISKTAWYYENAKSIDVVVECRDQRSDTYHRTLQVRIPTYKLRQSLRRIERPAVKEQSA